VCLSGRGGPGAVVDGANAPFAASRRTSGAFVSSRARATSAVRTARGAPGREIIRSKGTGSGVRTMPSPADRARGRWRRSSGPQVASRPAPASSRCSPGRRRTQAPGEPQPQRPVTPVGRGHNPPRPRGPRERSCGAQRPCEALRSMDAAPEAPEATQGALTSAAPLSACRPYDVVSILAFSASVDAGLAPAVPSCRVPGPGGRTENAERAGSVDDAPGPCPADVLRPTPGCRAGARRPAGRRARASLRARPPSDRRRRGRR
jgi:hypothetical protein